VARHRLHRYFFFLFYTMKTCRVSRGTAPLILNLSTRRRRVVSFTPWPLYLRESIPVPLEYETAWAPQPVWTVLLQNVTGSLPTIVL